jgi:hypothetical protein
MLRRRKRLRCIEVFPEDVSTLRNAFRVDEVTGSVAPSAVD